MTPQYKKRGLRFVQIGVGENGYGRTVVAPAHDVRSPPPGLEEMHKRGVPRPSPAVFSSPQVDGEEGIAGPVV